MKRVDIVPKTQPEINRAQKIRVAVEVGALIAGMALAVVGGAEFIDSVPVVMTGAGLAAGGLVGLAAEGLVIRSQAG